MKTFRYSVLLGSLLLINLQNSFGQSKFSVSVNLAPVYTHTDFSLPVPLPNSPVVLTEYAGRAYGLHYSVGLMGWYHFSSKWSASAGIWATHQAIGKTNITYNGVASSTTYQYNHPFNNYYKVPVQINYQPAQKKLSPYFSAGVSFDLRGTSYVDLFGDGTYTAVKFGKPVVVTPLVGVGLIYQLTNRLSLLTQPTFQYDLQARPANNYYHAYQVSLQTQLIWHL
ncbi:hypothetical protein [Spirosoma sp.]|uniref:hypothetical protein n=1 Tax=Spirosoma sp. TaxID=1899569 RepID=UPI002630486F|nr:hypothetical protein [Spirosoma sp.]MCX6218532.1 hypothetical protein [Spirosoma sp.]